MAQLTSFWHGVELVHDVVYFAPDQRARYQALGLKGGWMGYFASRSAALGVPSAAVVTATFQGFAPSLVARALPDAWHLVEREQVLAERLAIARDALAPLVAGLADGPAPDVSALAAELGEVVAGLDLAGKPLAAAEASLPVPADDLGALWRGATVLREFRGDCHVAVLVSEGLGGATANALAVATGRVPAGQRENRGWSESEWTAALADLRARGWLNADDTASISGRSTRDRIEDATDRACQANMTQAAAVAAEQAAAHLGAVATAVASSGLMPFPNPVGVGPVPAA